MSALLAGAVGFATPVFAEENTAAAPVAAATAEAPAAATEAPAAVAPEAPAAAVATPAAAPAPTLRLLLKRHHRHQNQN